MRKRRKKIGRKKIGRKRNQEQIRRKKEFESYNSEGPVFIDEQKIRKMGIEYLDALIAGI